jgi:hypothetical protein
MKAIIIGKNGKSSIRAVLSHLSDLNVFLYVKSNKGVWAVETLKNGHLRHNKVDQPVFGSGDTIIKWGNSIPVTTGSSIYYGNGIGVMNASNKLEARMLFKEENVECPYTFVRLSDRKDFPVIIRPLRHRAGKIFHVANNDTELSSIVRNRFGNKEYYCSSFYPKTREFRLHCAFGKILVTKEKPAPSNKSMIAWNYALNEDAWTTIDRKDYDINMGKLALRAMDALGLDIGAVDVMSYPTNKSMPEHTICEINTAPSLTPYLAEKYAMLFRKLFTSEEKIEKWNYQKFEIGKSLSWKNCQLEN